jgi:mRNA-degrading endonuclease RelE of RelBE toxin-antitoxin system
LGVSYELFLEPEVHAARNNLPGYIRQRVRRAITDLVSSPRPPESTAMDTRGLSLPDNVELRRIRMAQWRIVYAICDSEQWIWILVVRQRPPYQYGDLADLIDRLP